MRKTKAYITGMLFYLYIIFLNVVQTGVILITFPLILITYLPAAILFDIVIKFKIKSDMTQKEENIMVNTLSAKFEKILKYTPGYITMTLVDIIEDARDK